MFFLAASDEKDALKEIVKTTFSTMSSLRNLFLFLPGNTNAEYDSYVQDVRRDLPAKS